MDDNDNPLAGALDDSNPPSDDVLSNDKDDQFKSQVHTTNTTMLLNQDDADVEESQAKKSNLANI